MKPGKSDVTGSYTSDLLLHGPDTLFEFLAGMFRSSFVHSRTAKLCIYSFAAHHDSLAPWVTWTPTRFQDIYYYGAR